MLPIEIARSEKRVIDAADQIILELLVDDNLFWFDGHFSHQPILPGVAQLDWVMHYGTEILVPQVLDRDEDWVASSGKITLIDHVVVTPCP